MHDIIIVDDEVLVRLGIKSYIDASGLGINIAGTFSNGRDALEYCQTNKPEIVLTDITMPIMDGLQLIQELKKIYDDVKIIVLSCHDDYKYIKGAFKLGIVDYILKYELEEADILTLLNKIIEEPKTDELVSTTTDTEYISLKDIRHEILSELMQLKEGCNIPQVLTKKIKKYCPKLGFRNLFVILISIDNEYDDNYRIIPRQFDNFSIVDAISEILNQHGSGEIFINEDQTFTGLVTMADEASDKGIYNKLQGLLDVICKSFKIYFNSSISIGVSKKQHSLSTVNRAFLQAKENLSYKFYKGKGSILYENQFLDNGYLIDKNYIKKIHEAIIDKSFLLLNKSEIISEIKRYTNYMKSLKISPMGYKHEISSIVQIINVYLMDNYNTRIEQYIDCDDGLAIFKLIGELDNCVLLDKYTEYLIHNISDELMNLSKQISQISKIKKYIDSYYYEDLNLQYISDKFYMNKNYFCQYFKKEVGRNYIDYLTEIRIEKAKIMLKTSNLSTVEVAARVGFSNANYFIKVFKKITAKSITEYRNP